MVRTRDYGIQIGTMNPGANNAITDVHGVTVGYATVIESDDVRTGVTVVTPFDGREALFAGYHRLNGNGEMTGLQYIREMGILTSPIGITNTHSVGTVHSALVQHSVKSGLIAEGFTAWALPVVAETWDGYLNDINGFHVSPQHVESALTDASGGLIAEGNVGGGTGMVCHGFKGGTGTASRVLDGHEGGYVVGVLLQANHGRRRRLTVKGVPVGAEIPPTEVPTPEAAPHGAGSIIVIVATDAPLLPSQCERLAHRAALGIGRTGGLGEDSSGDIILAFSTANRGLAQNGMSPHSVRMLPNAAMNPLFEAVVEATEEAILNALLGAETMTGYRGRTVYALPVVRLVEILNRHGRGPTA